MKPNKKQRNKEKIMRPENKRMKTFLMQNGIDAMPKYIATGSLKQTWRLYNLKQQWTVGLCKKLNDLGFVGLDNKPLDKYSGNGGLFSIFARGHFELL